MIPSLPHTPILNTENWATYIKQNPTYRNKTDIDTYACMYIHIYPPTTLIRDPVTPDAPRPPVRPAGFVACMCGIAVPQMLVLVLMFLGLYKTYRIFNVLYLYLTI